MLKPLSIAPSICSALACARLGSLESRAPLARRLCATDRVEGLCASNTPPSQFDGRNVGGLTRRMRRVGRSSPKQFRNLTGRRGFMSLEGGVPFRCVSHFQCGRKFLSDLAVAR